MHSTPSRLRLAITRAGVAKGEVAERAGMHRQVLTDMLAGRTPGTLHLGRLAQVLNVPLEWLADGSNPPGWIRRQQRHQWPQLARQVSKASGSEMEECVNLRADQLHARAVAAGVSDFPTVDELQEILLEHNSANKEDDGEQRGRMAFFREMPRDEYVAIVLALAHEYAIANASHLAAGPNDGETAVRYLMSVEQALASIVFAYVAANQEQFPGGIDGPHGLQRVSNIIGHQPAIWSSLGTRVLGMRGVDL